MTLLAMFAGGVLAGAALAWVLSLIMGLVFGLSHLPASGSGAQALGQAMDGGSALLPGFRVPQIDSPLVVVGAATGGLVGLVVWARQLLAGNVG